MGAAPNPLQAAASAMLMSRLAGAGSSPGSLALAGGGPTGGPAAAGPAGSPADAAANAGFGRELSSLRQADPMAMVKAIQAVKQQIVAVISGSGMSIPGVARSLAKTLQGVDAAIKEAQTAAATMQMAAPIQASAAQGAPGMGATPGPSGPSMGGM